MVGLGVLLCVFVVGVIYGQEPLLFPVPAAAERSASSNSNIVSICDPSHHVDVQLPGYYATKIVTALNVFYRETNLQDSLLTRRQIVGNHFGVSDAVPVVRSLHRQLTRYRIDPTSCVRDRGRSTADVRDDKPPYEVKARRDLLGDGQFAHVWLLYDDVSRDQFGALSENQLPTGYFSVLLSGIRALPGGVSSNLSGFPLSVGKICVRGGGDSGNTHSYECSPLQGRIIPYHRQCLALAED